MRQKIGYVFLVVTLLVLVTAVNQGGFWWAAVMLSSAVTLWGIGVRTDE